MKRKYIKPEVEIVAANLEFALLGASGDTISIYEEEVSDVTGLSKGRGDSFDIWGDEEE